MTLRPAAADLPIDAVLPRLRAALSEHPAAVLVAPPGAGKTTRVPLALLDEHWLGSRKILMLEPRRIAARGAASFMSEALGERLGGTVGLRARLATHVSRRTRIEVVTEGVFTRLILDDPSLDGIGAIIFDEFHERSLDADLGLALVLDTQAALRPDLRVLVMSATLDGGRVAAVLGGAPVIHSESRSYPVETVYIGRSPARIEDDMAAAIVRAMRGSDGSILAFLPGQGEIARTMERLAAKIERGRAELVALHGGLDAEAQQRAVAPVPDGCRRIVLATSIAETSITIDGVRIVIDSGVARVPKFETGIGITRLETVRVSRATADQRRGRAGRTGPGVCYRLWDQQETQGLVAFPDPEIRSADLSSLLLDCAEWGTRDPRSLIWLDPPADGALTATRADLQLLGALDTDGAITPAGRRIRALPLPPRLAHMVLRAAETGNELAAANIAAVLVERGMGGDDTDLDVRLEAFARDRSRRASDMKNLATGWANLAGRQAPDERHVPRSAAQLLSLAFPDRIGKSRGGSGQFLLANGRAGAVDFTDRLARAPYIVAAALTGRAAATRILLAATATETEILEIAADRVEERPDLTFDRTSGSVRNRISRRLGAITLSSEARPVPRNFETAALLAEGIALSGINTLPWSRDQAQLRARVAYLRGADSDLPDLSDGALAASVADWLAPHLVGLTRISDINADVLAQALDAMLPWAVRQLVDRDAPTHFTTPAGNRHALDYEGDGAPALHVRVQELFGLRQHPAIANGRLPLTLYLLSPAMRPVQITRDLPRFWTGSWAGVKADMRGRYPRHSWPDDPANAAPASRAKPRAPR